MAAVEGNLGSAFVTRDTLAAEGVYEMFIPGFGVLSRIISTLFHIDISQYLPFLFIAALTIAASRYFFDGVSDFVHNHFMSSVQVQVDDEIYNYLMYWVSKQQFVSRSTDIFASSSMESEWDKIKPIHFTPALGTHYFWYKGRFLTIDRAREKMQMWTETLRISCLGRNTEFLRELIREAQLSYLKRDVDKTIIYRWTKADPSSSPSWTRCMARHPRPLSSVVLDQEQKDAFLNDVKDYLHPFTKRWYSNRGIPYRRGYLFYGPPGCGKTSLCFAVAGLLGLKIYVANLSSPGLTEEGLASLFATLPRRCIVLLEDIDTAGITKSRLQAPASTSISPSSHSSTPQSASIQGHARSENDEDDDDGDGAGGSGGHDSAVQLQGISLSALLNTIDGVASSEGRILVMTTNHAENLDPALLRPGRVDLMVEFRNAGSDAIISLFRAIYSEIEGDWGDHSSSSKKSEGMRNGEEIATKTKSNGAKPVASKTDTTPKVADRHSVGKTSATTTTPSATARRRTGHGLSADQIHELAKEFARQIPNEQFSPAHIQGFMLSHKASPRAAVEHVGEWVAKHSKTNNNQGADAVKVD
ncbi:mitochondrial chaperone ATPase (Bcs1) [Arthroderma uncinatum]|uniref:mitochondrial chaperone ATPase (Bcs1) n=1 Tax=Arthroderma uncinatum TaxID=74035 RepID=UPI00144A4D99|nr:mitochondrial chaperone ATPase (Bcs1) [Arthroderma uncinatum]KAF3480746.1 mitochondrial chaperone ATPase (Bcs1) [Arthroderma uncinatum]